MSEFRGAVWEPDEDYTCKEGMKNMLKSLGLLSAALTAEDPRCWQWSAR